VPIILVDPRNTSCTCPACGHCEKRNRLDQERFLCRQCGLAGLADYIAALYLRERGRAGLGAYRDTVSQPHADAVGSASSFSREPMLPALAPEPLT
jgi:transposase